MKITSINNYYGSNNNTRPKFKASWHCSYKSDFYQLGVDCFNSGKGERFFNAIKKFFDISPKSVLKFENRNISSTDNLLVIKNLKRRCCDETPKGVAKYSSNENVTEDSLKFIEETVDSESSKNILFGEFSQNHTNVNYIETSTPEEFMEKNIKQFCWGKTFLKESSNIK